MDEAKLVRPDWVITRPLLSGVCGSETKLVLGDFDTGDIDNPMAAFSSIPHIPGHEVVAEVMALGPSSTGLEVGQRVLLNPWLTCGPRGVDPPCPACQSGDLNLCWSFTEGALGPGDHDGVDTDAPDRVAELMALWWDEARRNQVLPRQSRAVGTHPPQARPSPSPDPFPVLSRCFSRA